MPIYHRVCLICGEENKDSYEVWTAEDIITCPVCHKKTYKKQITKPAICEVNGEGFLSMSKVFEKENDRSETTHLGRM